MSKIIPAKNYVILRPKEEKTPSGLDIVKHDKDMPQIGTVYKIGKGKLPLVMKVGDTAIYQKYMTNKTFIAQLGEEFDFIKFENIVAVIPEKKTK